MTNVPAIEAPSADKPSGWQEFWDNTRTPVPVSAFLGVIATSAVGFSVSIAELGIGSALIAVVAWIATTPALIGSRRWADLALSALSVALFSILAWRTSLPVIIMAIFTAIVIWVVAAVGATTALSMLISPLTAFATAIRAVPWFGRGIFRQASTGPRPSMGLIGALAVTVILVVVFGSLFAAADPVFAQFLPQLSLRELPERIFTGLLWAGVGIWLLHTVVVAVPARDLTMGKLSDARMIEWILPMGALVGLTGIFLLVQIGVLAGGMGALFEATGMTYAEYARQGFWQLLIATALIVVVVVFAAARAPRGTLSDRIWTTTTLIALNLLTIGVVVSALRRMNMYVAEFGLSQLRVLATWAEIVLGVLLVVGIIASALWRASWLPRVTLGVLGLAVVGLAVWNPDYRIVQSNAESAHGVDAEYLSTLSTDAVPAIAELPKDVRDEVWTLGSYETRDDTSWVAWNASRAEASRILEEK